MDAEWEFDDGEELTGLLAYLRDLEENTEEMDWSELDRQLEEMRKKDLEVDQAQSEHTDWRI